MGFYDDKETAEQYISMAKGYDGSDLIAELKNHLKRGASVLELGSGPGVDLELLSQDFNATGSDSSNYFVERLSKKQSGLDVLKLDAVTIVTDQTFDAIFSNKVLHHLSEDDLVASLNRQYEALNEPGYIFHSFWNGSKYETHCGMDFYYRTPTDIATLLGNKFIIIEQKEYKEMEPCDSHWVLAQKV